MSQFSPNKALLANLRHEVIVLTGGANGIGASTVRLLHTARAYTVFGDSDVLLAQKLVSELASNCVFVKTDVTSYADNLALFKAALSRHGRIDHAISIAGIGESNKWIGSNLSLDDIETSVRPSTLEVNLLGPCYFARIASVYLAHANETKEDKSIIFFSSIAGVKGGINVPLYTASKHGILGLMR